MCFLYNRTQIIVLNFYENFRGCGLEKSTVTVLILELKPQERSRKPFSRLSVLSRRFRDACARCLCARPPPGMKESNYSVVTVWWMFFFKLISGCLRTQPPHFPCLALFGVFFGRGDGWGALWTLEMISPLFLCRTELRCRPTHMCDIISPV